MTELRGNVDTRLRKLAAGEVDVLVLAAAGLERLGRRREAGGALHGEVFVPAPGQGVIAVQARSGAPAAEVAVAACHARTLGMPARPSGPPCANWPQVVTRPWESTRIACAFAASRACPTAREWLVDEIAVEGEDDDAFEAAGRELARRMLAAGAAELLRDAEAMAAR